MSFCFQCAVEAFVRVNPSWKLYIFSRTINETLFNEGKNIRIVSGWSFEQIFEGDQAFLRWFAKGDWKNNYPYHHLSDGVRLHLLETCGGLYIDTDIILTEKKLDALPSNFIGAEDHFPDDSLVVNNAVMRFEKLSTFMQAAKQDFLTTFNSKRFGYNGPQLVTRVISKIQESHAIEYIDTMATETTFRNSVIYILSPNYFYPVSWREVEKFFDGFRTNPVTYGMHLWQSLIPKQLDPNFMSLYHSESHLSHIFLQHCPRVAHINKIAPISKAQTCRIIIDNPLMGEQFHLPGKVFLQIHVVNGSRVLESKYILHYKLRVIVDEETRFDISNIELGTSTELQLTGLLPGKHIVTVGGSTPDTWSSCSPASISFSYLPHEFQQGYSETIDNWVAA
eukprot:augustus_masked-scaffold_27-processed-gene-0.0-mRNA-1 protein AED:1.00 eAED:1.00 QI:0/-1/0/0/-1/1/1/0/393